MAAHLKKVKALGSISHYSEREGRKDGAQNETCGGTCVLSSSLNELEASQFLICTVPLLLAPG